MNTFYGKSHILRDVSFDVRDNEIVALLGRNGAGKSTLLKTIIGIAPPASGSDHARRRGAGAAPVRARSRARGVAYVPQGRGLFAGMSVAENMELGRLKRRNDAGMHWDEEKIFAFFPRIKERWRSPADYLSGGEQQMVAVARALSGDTRAPAARRAVRGPRARGRGMDLERHGPGVVAHPPTVVVAGDQVCTVRTSATTPRAVSRLAATATATSPHSGSPLIAARARISSRTSRRKSKRTSVSRPTA